MKIYTKSGDDGTTGLFGGGRVRKDHLRVEAYGNVDEVSCLIGVVRAESRDAQIDAWLSRLQNELLLLGADLATPEGVKAASRVRRISPEDAAWMESAIDGMDKELTPLQTFILPAGTSAAAAAHLARAVCRRAERSAVALAADETIGAGIGVYLNRLSDFLFVLARLLNSRAGAPEEPWRT
jgi:cob(I)alamin adenosyltransferase